MMKPSSLQVSFIFGSIILLLFQPSSFGWTKQQQQQQHHFTAQEDAQVVKQQLGYVPLNFHSISAKTRNGEPIAIQTYPLISSSSTTTTKIGCSTQKQPFPTLFWLTHPDISKAIAELERRGHVALLEEQLNNNLEYTQQFYNNHVDYANDRWDSLTKTDQDWLLLNNNDIDDATLCSTIGRMRHMVRESGIAGANFVRSTLPNNTPSSSIIIPSIKCLHAHYGHYRSTEKNIVGMWVHQLLQQEFPNLVL